MKNPPLEVSVISPSAEMLLTSVGATTEAMQQRLFEIGELAGKTTLSVVRVSDGHTSFNTDDNVSIGGRIEQRIESVTANSWSKLYLKHVLGKIQLKDVLVNALSEEEFSAELKNADIFLVPGGNTFQTMRGLVKHEEVIRLAVANGLPYVGDSAGSIVAGLSLRPALLEPADDLPACNGQGVSQVGLGLINADIVTHAAGRDGAFALPGLYPRIASRVLKGYETTTQIVDEYRELRNAEGVNTYVLNDNQALSVASGVINLLG